jgi:hypothetical protein
MTSKLDVIANALAEYEAAIADCRGSDELAAVDSVFMASIHTDYLRTLLTVARAAVTFIEETEHPRIFTSFGSSEPDWQSERDKLQQAIAALTADEGA